MSRSLWSLLLESHSVVLHSRGGQLERMERKKGDPYPIGQSRGLPWVQAFNLAKVAGSLEMMTRKAMGVRYQTSSRLPGGEDPNLHIVLPFCWMPVTGQSISFSVPSSPWGFLYPCEPPVTKHTALLSWILCLSSQTHTDSQMGSADHLASSSLRNDVPTPNSPVSPKSGVSIQPLLHQARLWQ